MKDVVWHHSEFQQHSVTRRITQQKDFVERTAAQHCAPGAHTVARAFCVGAMFCVGAAVTWRLAGLHRRRAMQTAVWLADRSRDSSVFEFNFRPCLQHFLRPVA